MDSRSSPVRFTALAASFTAALTLLGACATAGAPPSPGDTTRTAAGTPAPQPGEAWTVKTREHVDLWLHGYAMLQRDTARVPFFRRGYRDSLTAVRRARGITSALDVNRDRLVSRLAANPALVNGQFLALYFNSLEDLQRVVDLTIQVQGDPRRTNDPELARYVGLVNASFPSAADRDWLRTFVQSITDEHRVFYRDYRAEQQRRRVGALDAVNSLWTRHAPALRRYLSNTQQAHGEMVLSLPLNGEGRTTEVGSGYYVVGVNFPRSGSEAPEALYTFVHEVVLATTTTAVTDNTTPAEQRSGAGASYTSNAAVRGGLLLLERLAPDLAAGYMRYYLAETRTAVPGGDAHAAFERAFPLPPTILGAIRAQLDVVLGGI